MAESADRTTVTRTTGMRASIWRSCFKTSSPDWSGRRRSRRMTSGRTSATRWRPSAPVWAISTRCAGAGKTWLTWSGSRPGWSSIKIEENDIWPNVGDTLEALGARVGDLDPVCGGREDVAHLVREQAWVVIDQDRGE